MNHQETSLKKLKKLQGIIDHGVTDYFDSPKSRNVVDQTLHGVGVYEKLKELSARPAKRLRGSLAYAAYEAYGGTNQQAALDLAVVFELMQNYLLIVDDVMDRSPTRRGDKTIHEQYHQELGGLSDAEHVSNMVGINAGLILSHQAASFFAGIDEDPANLMAANKELHQNLATTGYGQLEDELATVLSNISEDDILGILKFKTSFYTFVNPLKVGALLAGADESKLGYINVFGENAGTAFQIQDDIIGLFGVEDVTGKSTKDDVKEGKMTLLMLHALQNSSAEDVEFLEMCLGNPYLTNEQHAKVKQIVEKSGALSMAQKTAKQKTEQALAALGKSDCPNELETFIAGLMEYIISRDK